MLQSGHLGRNSRGHALITPIERRVVLNTCEENVHGLLEFFQKDSGIAFFNSKQHLQVFVEYCEQGSLASDTVKIIGKTTSNIQKTSCAYLAMLTINKET